MCNHVQDLRRDYRKHLRATEKCRNTLQSLHQKQAKTNDVERLGGEKEFIFYLFLPPPLSLSLSLSPSPFPSPSPSLSRSRIKFVNAAKKLHQCHNDYALSVVNVNIHQEYYRRTLLPFTLNTLQDRMQMQIDDW